MKRMTVMRCVLLLALMIGAVACAELEAALTQTPASTPAASPTPEAPEPALVPTATPTPTLTPTPTPDTRTTPVHEDGCTRSQGYWRTHSRHGPEPRDPTWDLVGPDGEDTPFYDSGQTWYEVLVTPPVGGDAYYVLASQYIAARLNRLSSASSTTEVNAALDWAEDNFESETPQGPQQGPPQGPPQDPPPGPPRDGQRDEALARAELLDRYNSGRIGPGPCRD